MAAEPTGIGASLAGAKDALVMLARIHLDRDLWSKIDPEDMAQKTLLEAWAQRDRFRGDESQQWPWLRQMLLHNIFDAVRHFRRGKCNVALERALDCSSARLIESLAVAQSSPSQKAARNEDMARLAEALTRLPREQQEAVILHHLHGLRLTEVAEHQGRSLTAVAGLIHRGLTRLRQLMKDGDSHE
jgi:RNA polymerase sigma-70 factor, ECF subfamily